MGEYKRLYLSNLGRMKRPHLPEVPAGRACGPRESASPFGLLGHLDVLHLGAWVQKLASQLYSGDKSLVGFRKRVFVEVFLVGAVQPESGRG